MRKSVLHFLAFFLVPILLSGCDGMFNDTGLAPLKGERISVLQLQAELTPDPEFQKKRRLFCQCFPARSGKHSEASCRLL